MELKLLVREGGRETAVRLECEPGATVATLVHALVRSRGVSRGEPLTLSVLDIDGTWTPLPPRLAVAESGLCSGDVVTSTPAQDGPPTRSEQPGAAVVTVLSGLDASKRFTIPAGDSVIGRGKACDIRLDDPMVSKRHAVLHVSATLEISDEFSSNGIQVAGVTVGRCEIGPDTTVTLGETEIQVHRLGAQPQPPAADAPFNRSPLLDPAWAGTESRVPRPVRRPVRPPLPTLTLLAPLVLAGVFYLLFQSLQAVLFIALTPVLLLGSFLEQWFFVRREFRRAVAGFRQAVARVRARAEQDAAAEVRGRRSENPSVRSVLEAVAQRRPLMWSRPPDHPRALQVRLGLADLPSRNRLSGADDEESDVDPQLLAERDTLVADFRIARAVPVAVDLRAGGLGVAGPRAQRVRVAGGLLVQLSGLHAPGDLVLLAAVPAGQADDWSWLAWLPHTGDLRRPVLGVDPLGADPHSCTRILVALEELLERRVARRHDPVGAGGPAVLLLVADPPPVDRGRLVRLLREGPPVGIHLIWCADRVEDLPAPCRAYLDLAVPGEPVPAELGGPINPPGSNSPVDPADLGGPVDPGTGLLDPATVRGAVGLVPEGIAVSDVSVESPDPVTLVGFARRLAPALDAAALADRQADLPTGISFLDAAGRDVAGTVEGILERWRESGSLPGDAPRAGTLRAVVGRSASGPLHLDLREDGPHALVGGTTGAGKSEFLQAWILGMAVAHSPLRVNFLLVDYKGGSAFSECSELPHTVGMVTDLTPRLVRRALTSLRAELRYREEILAAQGVPDLVSLERSGVGAPPSLVIVVDEFAALVEEIPEFVDGVIDVAQRGRSLGLHLVLATQRPAGVIRANLRANTNLRVALRMADEEDSFDVVGTAAAALLDPAVPGRAIVRTGPGRVTAFQALYAGGRTPAVPEEPGVRVTALGFGPATALGGDLHHPGEHVADGPSDIRRVVETLRGAVAALELPPPRRPWTDVLPEVLDLGELDGPHTDDDLLIGLADLPAQQRRVLVGYRPDADGAMAVIGTGGSGKSTVLRALALAVGRSRRSGPGLVYGIDCGARGLAALEALPYVGSIVTGDDHERVARLLTWLRDLVDGRAARWAAVGASGIGEYRRAADEPDEPRIFLLVDHLGGFRQIYEDRLGGRLFDLLQGLAAEGRAVGVHVVVSADRPAAIPSALASAVQKRLVLKLVQEMDLSVLGLRTDTFAADSPPGRGILDGAEVQIAVPGADPGTAGQNAQIAAFGELLRRRGVAQAPAVGRLPERVLLGDLPVRVEDLPSLGIADDTLQPMGFAVDGPLIITGPPQSGRSSAVATVAAALRRALPDLPLLHLGTDQSLASSVADWAGSAYGAQAVAEGVARVGAELAAGRRFGVLVEDLPAFLGGPAEYPLDTFLRACLAAGCPVIASGETQAMVSSYPVLLAVRAGRHGLLLQPDQTDGDLLLRTTLPRVSRAEFPPGRGLYVRSGRIRKVQVALPG